jgi:hypothetical protein
VFNKKLLEGRTRFPFPYVDLHNFINGSEAKEIMAVLYLDSNLKIRSAEIHEFDEGHLFTKEQVLAMTTPMIEEVKILREDLAKKELELKDLKEKVNSMGLFKL